MHDLIRLIERLLIHMKRVGVFHSEFARTHNAKPWATLVAEFGLYLVQIRRELAVAINFIADEVSNNLFMGWAEAKIAVMPVFETQQFGTHCLPAAGFKPKLGGLYNRHRHLHRTRLVHLLSHYFGDLTQHSEA